MTSTTLDVDNQNLRLPTAIVGMFISRILVDLVVFAAEQSEQFQLAELDPSLFVVDNFPEWFRVSATQRGMVLMLTDQMTGRKAIGAQKGTYSHECLEVLRYSSGQFGASDAPTPFPVLSTRDCRDTSHPRYMPISWPLQREMVSNDAEYERQGGQTRILNFTSLPDTAKSWNTSSCGPAKIPSRPRSKASTMAIPEPSRS